MNFRWGIYISFVLLCACNIGKQRKASDFSGNYRKNQRPWEQKFWIFNLSDSTVRVFFDLSANDLLHTRTNAQESFQYALDIRYKLYTDYAKKIWTDTASALIHEVSDPYDKKTLRGSFDVRARLGQHYWLEIITKDVYKNSSQADFIAIDRQERSTKHDFWLEKKGYQLFDPLVFVGDSVRLHTHKNDSTYVIQHFYKDFAPASPPFSLVEETIHLFDTDSLFELSLKNRQGTLNLNKKGLYYLRKDTLEKNGFPLLCFDPQDFPKIQTPQAMIAPLRYITSKKEYTDMDASKSREVVERFWLNITGNNKDRSRGLIKEYYSRVYLANLFFTSYLEGWKTDRGMMYIVFGEPDAVYKAMDQETWIYGNEGSFNHLTFTFTRLENPLSDQDYSLNRSSIYRSTYYKAVDYWRQGKIDVLP